MLADVEIARMALRRKATSVEVIDGMEITPYASRFPKAKRTNDEALDGIREQQENASKKIITLLQHHQGVVINQLAMLQSSISSMSKPQRSLTSAASFHDS